MAKATGNSYSPFLPPPRHPLTLPTRFQRDTGFGIRDTEGGVSAIRKRCRKTRVVLMADRESDIHELFAEQAQTAHGADLLIRAERSRNRKAEDEHNDCDFLWPMLQRQEPIGVRELLVAPGPKRPARQAVLEVRTMPVLLRAPKRKPHLPNVRVWAVLASEPNAPEGVEALEWMLLSTVKVNGKADAYERLDWYARRWGIEIYHRILKSGCRIEARQLETATRLRNCLAIDMIIAWRIHHLTYLGKETPDVPCTVYFSALEWKALWTFVKKNKDRTNDASDTERGRPPSRKTGRPSGAQRRRRPR